MQQNGPSAPLPAGWLERELLARGWSVSDLARHTGVKNNTLGRAYRGARVALRTRAAIFRAFEEHPVS